LAIRNAKVSHRVTSVKSAAPAVRGAVQRRSKKQLYPPDSTKITAGLK